MLKAKEDIDVRAGGVWQGSIGRFKDPRESA
jgi:hypothetical protein